jgi:hypothetical protein
MVTVVGKRQSYREKTCRAIMVGRIGDTPMRKFVRTAAGITINAASNMKLWQRCIWTAIGFVIVSPLALLLIGMLMSGVER